MTVRVNRFCNNSYSVTLAFGTRPKIGGEDCKVGLNATTVALPPGESHIFDTYTDDLPLAPEETYCYIINGVSYTFNSTSPGDPGGAVVTLPSTLLIMMMILLVTATLG